MALRIHNTLTGKKEEFVPLREGEVGFYMCGMTVQDVPHIGHMRSAITADIIRRYLRYKEYNVTFLYNFTDIDDKIIARASEENVPCQEIARRNIDAFVRFRKMLGIVEADLHPRATEHMDDIIDLVRKLEEKGYAYRGGSDVYFNVRKWKKYGVLSHRKIDELRSGTRIEPGESKRDNLDFTLWKGAKEGEPAWESPWGKGRPGWHIECSAMSMKYLGTPFDLHGGGSDLIFPHHENEIAQSEAATGKTFVRYWLHNGMVNLTGEKMSKSTGHFFAVGDIFEKFHPAVVRFYLSSSHYRSPIEFNVEQLEQSRSAFERFITFFDRAQFDLARLPEVDTGTADDQVATVPGGTGEKLHEEIASLPGKFEEAMDDDFNSAAAIGILYDLVKTANIYIKEKQNLDEMQYLKTLARARDTLLRFGTILGIFGPHVEMKGLSSHPRKEIEENLIKVLVDTRQKARAEKMWELADYIRNRLKELEIVLEDTKDGATVWRRHIQP
jgi:cysteinyl-tRNA synthetase